MRVFNADQRAKLLGTCSRLYLSKVGEDAVVYAAPEPSKSGDGAWCSVRFFVRYDDAGMDAIEQIARRFHAQWADAVRDDAEINGVDAVDTIGDFVRDMDQAIIEGAE